MYGAKLRTQNEQAEKLRLENEFTRAEVLNRRELMGVLSRVADAVVSRVMSSSLERTIKEDILRDIASIPVALQETADKQTRLPRGNGHRHNVDDDEQSES